MFRRPFEGLPDPIEQPVPTAETGIPHPVLEVTKAMRSRLTQVWEVGQVSRCAGGSDRLPRLVLKHLELRSPGSPSMVEIAEEPAVFPINAARKPNTHKATQLRLELGAQEFLHGPMPCRDLCQCRPAQL